MTVCKWTESEASVFTLTHKKRRLCPVITNGKWCFVFTSLLPAIRANCLSGYLCHKCRNKLLLGGAVNKESIMRRTNTAHFSPDDKASVHTCMHAMNACCIVLYYNWHSYSWLPCVSSVRLSAVHLWSRKDMWCLTFNECSSGNLFAHRQQLHTDQLVILTTTTY